MSDIAVQTLPVTSTMHSNQLAPTRPTRPIRLRQSIGAIPADLLQQTASVSTEIADDIVAWAIGRGQKKPSEYAKTMRRMVEQILDKHSSLFRGLITRLNMANSDLFASVTAIANEEFGDGEANWGRIVVLCAFVARLAGHFQENGLEENVDVLTEFLRSYFRERLNDWIATQGGWDQFARRFQTDSSLEPTIFKGLLATGLALGVIAGVIAMR